MATKSYEKKVARLVQDAAEVTYSEALRLVRYHQDKHPEHLTTEARALAIVDGPRALRESEGETIRQALADTIKPIRSAHDEHKTPDQNCPFCMGDIT